MYDNEEMIRLQDVVRARWYFNPNLKNIVGPTVVVPVYSLTVILETELKPISSFEDSQVKPELELVRSFPIACMDITCS